ncbi:MAG: hypothetical protein M3495_11345 [Pseudomonadota bacterium]|nr:hypothetical protein [Gammaproteobacteria bacterium]MDQ3582157.1 hypothetical protein [Pseudomonadota bacterium]
MGERYSRAEWQRWELYHTFIFYPGASSLKVVLSTDAPREAAAGLVFFSTDRSVRSRLGDVLDAFVDDRRLSLGFSDMERFADDAFIKYLWLKCSTGPLEQVLIYEQSQ